MKYFLFILLIFNSGGLFGQYRVFSDLTNLFRQEVIKTKDGGFLLVSGEDCYTPGSITIEGCMYALHLVRTNASGDTIWTNRIGFSGSFDHIFENNNGSFTLFSIYHDTTHPENY